jgi:hypothetical protein
MTASGELAHWQRRADFCAFETIEARRENDESTARIWEAGERTARQMVDYWRRQIMAAK